MAADLLAVSFGDTCHANRLSHLGLCLSSYISSGKTSTFPGELMMVMHMQHDPVLLLYVLFCCSDTVWSVGQELLKVPQKQKADPR